MSTNFPHSPLSGFAAPLLSPPEKLAPFHKNITKSKSVSLVPTDQSTGAFLSSPLACAAFFLPLFVARKDVVAGELPAASATTQVQDGETERGEEEEGATVGGGRGSGPR